MKNSIKEIQQIVLKKTRPDDRKIKGIWAIDYFHMPTDSQLFDLKLILSQTTGHGCAYSPEKNINRDLLKSLINNDIFTAKNYDNIDYSIKISVLDSLYGTLYPPTGEKEENKGNSIDKNKWRTKIVLNEIQNLIGKNSSVKKILNVGVVASFMETLRNEGYDIVGSDLDDDVVNSKIAGTKIVHGKQSPFLARKVDLVIATGMTIATKTIDRIITECNMSGTKLIVFAETGHNFANYYIENGVDVYISESFPFYSMEGSSTITICRK